MSQQAGQRFLEEASRYKPDLPYPPSLLRDLFSMTREDSLATVDDIAEVVGRDQGMTAKILALANSAFYGLQAKVASLSRGVSLLGIKEIRSLVLLLGVQSLTSDVAMPKGFDLTEYWEHQLTTAVLCRAQARLLLETAADAPSCAEQGPGDPDILFTCGLLHDFGKLVVALNRPSDHEAIAALYGNGETTWAEAEEAYWGIEHGLIGGMVLGAWDLPAELTEPISWHHAPEPSPDHARDATIVSLSDALAHEHTAPGSPEARPWPQLAQALRLDPDTVRQRAEDALADEDIFQFLSILA